MTLKKSKNIFILEQRNRVKRIADLARQILIEQLNQKQLPNDNVNRIVESIAHGSCG